MDKNTTIITKATLIDEAAELADMSKKDVRRALEAFTELIVNHVKNDETVQIIKFGKFYKKNSSARVGRNPQTGEVINIQPHQNLGFKGAVRFDEE